MKAPVKKLSICPCGFPVLKTDIPLGTFYEVNPFDIMPIIWTCGGCQAKQNGIAVRVGARYCDDVPIYMPGWLPIEIFGIEKTKTPADSSGG